MQRGNSDLLIQGGSVITPDGTIENGAVFISNGKIAGLGYPDSFKTPDSTPKLDVTDCLVLPGFIDTHFHGCGGDDVMTAGAEGICRMARKLPQFGVTGFLPTTVSAPHAQILAAIHSCDEARRYAPAESSRILGMHIEGPFINPFRKGAQPTEGIRDPNPGECEEYISAASDIIRMMTFAPEMPEADTLIAVLCQAGAVPSMGHSDADYDTACHAIHCGASHATHLFNQMAPLHHRKPGLIGACLSDSTVIVELITDGVHLSPAIVRLAVAAKGPDRVALITDAISALGMPEGEYNLGSHRVRVHGNRCSLADGTLAGSVHRMDLAFVNTMAFADCGPEAASRMASAVPARVAGVGNRKGALAPGMDADITVMKEGRVMVTIIEGKVAYQAAL